LKEWEGGGGGVYMMLMKTEGGGEKKKEGRRGKSGRNKWAGGHGILKQEKPQR